MIPQEKIAAATRGLSEAFGVAAFDDSRAPVRDGDYTSTRSCSIVDESLAISSIVGQRCSKPE